MTNPYGQQMPHSAPMQAQPGQAQPYGSPSAGMPAAPYAQPYAQQQAYQQQPFGQQAPYGQPYGAGMANPYGPPIPDYKGWAIGSIFLCWIVAIFAIMKSNEVTTHQITGNMAAAQQASQQTRTLCLVATCLGVAGWLLGIIWLIVALSSAPDITYSRY
ncbi:CD225/dispanin family protein [Saccharomonospora azurea]|uniref:CD225/dispanin family protein n=1 Tax=Saccharomonospora azurea TaxID=40988 RepID=UPI003D90C57E